MRTRWLPIFIVASLVAESSVLTAQEERSAREVGLSDSTNSGFLGSYRYYPYLELGGARFFNTNVARFALGADLFAPLWQAVSQRDLVFTHLRIFDRIGKSFEGNIHVGYRHLAAESEQVYGIYGAWDRKRSDYGHYYNQLTVGAEWWRQKFFVGGNFYQPIGTKARFIASGEESVEVIQNNIWITRDDRYEKALQGGDIQIGYELVPGVTAYAGGYYFTAPDVAKICGPQIRLAYNWSLAEGKRILGIFDQIGLETGIQRDAPRGTSYHLGARLRIGLGNQAKNNLQGVARHMVDLVRRDVDIISQTYAKRSYLPYIDTNGEQIKLVELGGAGGGAGGAGGGNGGDGEVISEESLAHELADAHPKIISIKGHIGRLKRQPQANGTKTLVFDDTITIVSPHSGKNLVVNLKSGSHGTISREAFNVLSGQSTAAEVEATVPAASTLDEVKTESEMTTLSSAEKKTENIGEANLMVEAALNSTSVIENTINPAESSVTGVVQLDNEINATVINNGKTGEMLNPPLNSSAVTKVTPVVDEVNSTEVNNASTSETIVALNRSSEVNETGSAASGLTNSPLNISAVHDVAPENYSSSDLAGNLGSRDLVKDHEELAVLESVVPTLVEEVSVRSDLAEQNQLSSVTHEETSGVLANFTEGNSDNLTNVTVQNNTTSSNTQHDIVPTLRVAGSYVAGAMKKFIAKSALPVGEIAGGVSQYAQQGALPIPQTVQVLDPNQNKVTAEVTKHWAKTGLPIGEVGLVLAQQAVKARLPVEEIAQDLKSTAGQVTGAVVATAQTVSVPPVVGTVLGSVASGVGLAATKTASGLKVITNPLAIAAKAVVRVLEKPALPIGEVWQSLFQQAKQSSLPIPTVLQAAKPIEGKLRNVLSEVFVSN